MKIREDSFNETDLFPVRHMDCVYNDCRQHHIGALEDEKATDAEGAREIRSNIKKTMTHPERQPDRREERQEARKDLALLLLDVLRDEASDTERLSTVRSICENLTKPPEEKSST